MNGYHPPKDQGTDYPAIRQWGYQLGSYGYYIDIQLERARKDKAPWNATYYGPDYEKGGSRWHTVNDIKDLDNRPSMAAFRQWRGKEPAK